MNLLKFNVFCNGKFKRYWYLYFYIGYSYTYYEWICNFKCLQLIQSVIWKESHLLQLVACIHVDVMNVNYLSYFLEWLIDDVRRKTWIWYIGQGQGLAFKDLYVLSAALKKIHSQWKEVCQVSCIHIKLSILKNKPIPKTVISNCTFLYLNANIKFNINILDFESLWLRLDVPI